MMSCLLPALRRAAAAASLSALLAACGSMSGLDGRIDYACQAPPGVQCNSVSGNYANAIQNKLPSQRRSTAGAVPPTIPKPGAAAAGKGTTPKAAEPAAPLRAPPQIMRLWVKAWEDADRDLIDQGYVYLQVDPGRWRLDHVHQRARDAYAPIRPPHPTAAAPASPSSTPGPAPAIAAPARVGAPQAVSPSRSPDPSPRTLPGD